MFGILAAGAVYNPIDTEYPDERAAAIIEDAAPPVILTSRAEAARARRSSPHWTSGRGCWCWKNWQTPERAGRFGDLVKDTDPLDLAYVMFTSGSTGRPKGVEVSHGALAALLASHRETLMSGMAARRTVAHTTGVGFDASWDPILWLVEGHELHLVDDGTRRDSEQLAAYFDRHGINVWETTPGYLRQLLSEPVFTGLLDRHAGDAGSFSLALGGEAFDAGLWSTISARPGVQAWNLYGPTEATVDTVLARVSELRPSPCWARPPRGRGCTCSTAGCSTRCPAPPASSTSPAASWPAVTADGPS